jgi:chromosome partitioning protein
VDLDPQGSATRYLGLDPKDSPNLYEVYVSAKAPALAIRKTGHQVDMLTSHPYLAAVEPALESGEELKLAGFLQPLKFEYDFILIDNPPGRAKLTYSGLAAADLVLVACSAEKAAADGVGDMFDYITKTLWTKFPDLPDRQEVRVLFTMYRSTTAHSPRVVANAQKVWRDNVLKVTVPHAAVFSRSYEQHNPVTALEPRHPGALAYDVLADWLIKYEDTTH